MRDVYIIGIGQTEVGEHWDRSLRSLAVEAVRAALRDAGVARPDALYIGNMLSGGIASQEHIGALVADFAGLRGIEAVKVEAACGSGGAAVRQGFLAIASGVHDVVVAGGVEKMTDKLSHCTTAMLAMAADGDYEAIHGVSFVALNAMLMQRYLYQYKISRDDFAVFTLNAHRNSAHNRNAMFPFNVSMQQYQTARMVCDPINLLDSSPITDGAAALVLVSGERLRDFDGWQHAVRIAGSAIATDTIAVHDRRDPMILDAVTASTYKALRQAGVKHNDVDLFEVHDAFSIMAAMSLEAAGFAEQGQAVHLANTGYFSREGKLPIATMGGLKGRGHPVGATGAYQILEVALQLRGEAGANQIPAARVGLAQNIGGSGATVVSHILTV